MLLLLLESDAIDDEVILNLVRLFERLRYSKQGPKRAGIKIVPEQLNQDASSRKTDWGSDASFFSRMFW